MAFWQLILGIGWLLVPAYLSNMSPPIIAKIVGGRWAWPADFGLSWKGKRILGDHKTIRGFVAGTLLGVLAGLFQGSLAGTAFVKSIQLVDYASINGALLGALLGFGALLGDSVKSFFKRRVGIRPGGRWIPFDQIDFVIGAFLLIWPLAPLSWQVWLLALALHPALTIGVKHLGYYIGINDEKW